MSKPEKRKRSKNRSPLIAFIICTILALGISILSITPKSYAYEAGDVAEELIKAPREVTDELTTEENKKKARDAIPTRYVNDPTLTIQIEKDITAYFSAINDVKLKAPDLLDARQKEYDTDYYRQFTDEGATPAPPKKLTYEDENGLKEEDYAVLRSLLPAELSEIITNRDILNMINAEEANLEMAGRITLQYVNEELSAGIKETEFEDKKNAIYERIEKTLDTPEITEMARMSLDLMKPNSMPDEEATEEERKAAEDSVQPTVYKKGQVIIREGDIINEKQIEVLRSLGMLAGGLNMRMYISVILAIVAGAISCAMFATIFNKELAGDGKKVLLCGIVVLISLAVTALFVQINVRFIPSMFVPLVIAVCIDYGTASILGIISCALSAVIMSGSGIEVYDVFSYILTGLMACPVAAICADRFNSRVGIMFAGIIAGITAACVSAVISLQAGMTSVKILETGLYHILAGVISSILCIGSTPVWESVFNILTPMKLMELCNSTNHLLKRLALEAPGTYHHSTMVANLSEAAAEAIGANALLARAGAYYHDVGKLKAPMYYKENQNAENPHDFLVPEESARIIAMHTIDGAKMIRDARLPEELAEIAAQHHGTYLMGYFYQTAVNKYGEVNEANFRHIGGLPTSREAAIVMLADSTEAAVRADSTNYMDTIHKLIMSRLEDGQLNEAPITLLDLEKIANAFDGVLRGAYHNRIKYPEMKKPDATALPSGNE